MGEQAARGEQWFRLAPAAAAVCLAATWVHYFWSGGVALQVWPRSASVVWPSLLATLGLVLLGACCVAIYRSVNEGQLRKVLVTAVAVHLLLLPALPLFSTDLFSYLAYGELAAHGFDMKAVGPSAVADSAFTNLAQWRDTPSVYGPLADVLMSAAGHVGHWLGSPVWGAGVAYKLITGGLDLLSIFLMYGVAKSSRSLSSVRGFALFALNPLPAWELMSQGHNDVIIVVAAAAYIWSIERGKETLGVVSLMLGTLGKFVLAPTLALHLWVAVRQSFARALKLGLLCLALLVVFCAPGWKPGATLATWLPQLRPGTYLPFYSGTSIFTLIWKVLHALRSPESLEGPAFKLYGWVGKLVILAVLVFVVRRAKTPRDLFWGSLVLLTSVLCTAVVYAPWYVTWTLPFAAVVADSRWQRLLLGMSVVAAPALGIPGLWVVLPLTQIAGLVGLALWTRDVAADAVPAPAIAAR